VVSNDKKCYDHGDYCLRQSLYTIAKKSSDNCFIRAEGLRLLNVMEKECKLSPLSLFPIKSEEYTWSRSDGLTRFLYDHFFKYLGLDFHKGLNHDQLRAYYLYLYLTKQRGKAVKHLLSLILRLGFAPSMMEHCLFKPQAYICLLATIWKPLQYLVYPFFKWSAMRNLEASVASGTTNKITLLPTLKALGYMTKVDKMDSREPIYTVQMGNYSYIFSKSHIDKIYDTYFCQDDNRFIGVALKESFS